MSPLTQNPATQSPAAQPGAAFVIGHPVSHSLSPSIHAFWLNQYSLDGHYTAHDIFPDDLEAFFKQLKSGRFIGGNVTLPHKERALELCENVSDEAKAIGAVNTIYLRDEKICGTNTDAYGFLANLNQNHPGWDEKLDNAIVLGAGGAARAIILALIKRTAKNIVILNRTEAKAHNLAAHFSTQAGESDIIAAGLEQFERFAPDASLLVNTTSVGLNGTCHHGLELKSLKKTALVTDIVYNPLKTPLLEQAARWGLATVNGLGMLLHQAVPGFELWFGVRPAVTDKLRQTIERHMQGL